MHSLQHDPVDNVKLLTEHVFKIRTSLSKSNLISLSDFTLMFNDYCFIVLGRLADCWGMRSLYLHLRFIKIRSHGKLNYTVSFHPYTHF